MLGLICHGDKTDHGGTVIYASGLSTTMGRRWAVLGDMVACPRCKGVYPIVQADPTLTDEGRPVAYHGCKTACGATLLAQQSLTTTTPRAGGGSNTAAAPATAGAVGVGVLASFFDGADEQPHRGRFQLLDQSTGKPVSGRRVRVTTGDGQVIESATDAEGYTDWVQRHSPDSLQFELLD
ncbi:PAAR domain-containing protein [Burkholderia ubonensis]|uniref:PAAR domain-containing protein n=1 Tax=Burkholderia ubonensis TaxID=101571 RepID=UPI0009B2F2CC|nr:PAAR domain-containing protein [Burkholderia ubonensis]